MKNFLTISLQSCEMKIIYSNDKLNYMIVQIFIKISPKLNSYTHAYTHIH